MKWMNKRTLEVEQERKLARIAMETGASVEYVGTHATAAGDYRKLRGIPAIGRGVSGAIQGTRPGDSLADRKRR
jgi:hypothetical protein